MVVVTASSCESCCGHEPAERGQRHQSPSGEGHGQQQQPPVHLLLRNITLIKLD